MSLLDHALEYHHQNISVVPAASDGSKRPAIAWKTYTSTRPTEEQLIEWFTDDTYDGLGLICGAVSGQLEMLEVEGRAIDLVAALAQLMTDNGLAELWTRLSAGYLEQSPSGGLHWLYKVTDGPARPNTKLARRPGPPDPVTGRPTVDVLIETRGEGGFTIAAPSAGRVHPTGLTWKRLAGTPATIPDITTEERDALHAIANMLDSMPVEEVRAPLGGQTPRADLEGEAVPGTRPGDDYNNRTPWDEILIGWTRSKTFNGGGTGWTRPGKSARDGISATTGTSTDGVDRLYVFSSSTEFDTEKPYDKFAAYTLLHHHGDFTAAAKALGAAGYGTKTPEPTRTLTYDPGPTSTGNLATVTELPARDPERHLTAVPETTLERSEDGHAQQLIESYGDLIRYCPQRGVWLTWDGSVWQWQQPGGGEVREYAKKIARTFPQDDQASVAHKRRALSASGTSGCLKQAESDPRVTVQIKDLDNHPWHLNTPAGMIDLRTGELSPPDPDMLATKMTAAAPDFTPDPTFDKFLADTFANNHELRDYVQRLIGVSLIGTVREQVLPFAQGPGANGKSTLLEAVMHAVGIGAAGYAMAAPAEMLMIRKHSEHPAELAQLAGARLVVCSELDDGQKFAEAKIKQLTGRDSINARFLYGQPFTFQPSHTIWLLGNHRPQARTGGQAFWRRVKLIDFAHVVPTVQRDPALGDKLAAAAGHILGWAIQGAVDYVRAGIREPTEVSQAVSDYAADQDTIGRFVEDQIHQSTADAARAPVIEVRAAYEAWCNEAGEVAASAKRLTQELRDRFNIETVKSNGRRFYSHMTLLAGDDEHSAGGGNPW